jgi:hypothetical protein
MLFMKEDFPTSVEKKILFSFFASIFVKNYPSFFYRFFHVMTEKFMRKQREKKKFAKQHFSFDTASKYMLKHQLW